MTRVFYGQRSATMRDSRPDFPGSAIIGHDVLKLRDWR